jgi:hypothetical protein
MNPQNFPVFIVVFVSARLSGLVVEVGFGRMFDHEGGEFSGEAPLRS